MGADRSKRAPTTLGQEIYPRNGGHLRHFLGNIMGYASHSHINDRLSNQIMLAFSLYDLRCIILTFRKQIIAFKKGIFAPPAPPTERQEYVSSFEGVETLDYFLNFNKRAEPPSSPLSLHPFFDPLHIARSLSNLQGLGT